MCVLMLPLSGSNRLTGQIPPELGNLENLSNLDLGRCRYEICMLENNETITNQYNSQLIRCEQFC